MLKKEIFKAYDIRGLYPEDINEESLLSITKALISLWNQGAIVIAHDGRHGSYELALYAKRVLEEEEASCKKFEVVFVGLATTPMFYFLVNHFDAMGGMMITASHNPKEYNGVKAVGPKAVPFSGKDVLAVIEKK